MRREGDRGGERIRSFDTPFGRAAIGWTEKGISSLRLPEERRRGGERPRSDPAPPHVRRLIREVQRYFRGGNVSFPTRLDLSGTTPFERAVYRAARSIPAGSVRTYGEVARAIGRPRAARGVGAALGRNPVGLLIPCHRVVSASGVGGFSAPGGLALKRKMLDLEGVPALPST